MQAANVKRDLEYCANGARRGEPDLTIAISSGRA